jgi:hypothetical protein
MDSIVHAESTESISKLFQGDELEELEERSKGVVLGIPYHRSLIML